MDLRKEDVLTYTDANFVINQGSLIKNFEILDDRVFIRQAAIAAMSEIVSIYSQVGFDDCIKIASGLLAAIKEHEKSNAV